MAALKKSKVVLKRVWQILKKTPELILEIISSLSLFSPETKIWDSSWNKHSLFNFSPVDASRIERLADLQLAL